jgi:ParB/RepB/Spo0J family partition protein
MARKTNTTEIVTRKARCATIKIDLIHSEWNHRLDGNHTEGKAKKEFGALKSSIETNGILNPLLVKENDDDTYTLIDGRRRLEAAKLLGYKTIRVVKHQDIEEKEELFAIVANTNQKALSAVELGLVYSKLIKSGAYSNNRELANALGLSEATVGSKIKNLELDERIIGEYLSGQGATNDQKVLKAIRLLEKAVETDEGYASKKQWEAYAHIKEHTLGRKEALAYIGTLREENAPQTQTDTETSGFLKEETEGEIKVVIEKEGLASERVEQIEALLIEIERLSRVSDEALAA